MLERLPPDPEEGTGENPYLETMATTFRVRASTISPLAIDQRVGEGF